MPPSPTGTRGHPSARVSTALATSAPLIRPLSAMTILRPHPEVRPESTVTTGSWDVLEPITPTTITTTAIAATIQPTTTASMGTTPRLIFIISNSLFLTRVEFLSLLILCVQKHRLDRLTMSRQTVHTPTSHINSKLRWKIRGLMFSPQVALVQDRAAGPPPRVPQHPRAGVGIPRLPSTPAAPPPPPTLISTG